MKNRFTCNYCIYCIYERQEYHCRYHYEDYIIEKTNPCCEDFIEAERTARQNRPFCLPRKMK